MDATGNIGDVLTKEGILVVYILRKRCPHRLNYPTDDLKLLAVVHALRMTPVPCQEDPPVPCQEELLS